MKIQLILANMLLAALTVQAGGPKVERSNDAAAFARLKTLVGEWEADTRMGKAHLSYELIAGGTALVEKESTEKMPAMLTVYHLDGQRLLLTHYCMAGNQPRMQARAFNTESGELEFQFLDATNLANPGAGHMQSAKFRFVDNDHLATEWEFLREQPAEDDGNCAVYARTVRESQCQNTCYCFTTIRRADGT